MRRFEIHAGVLVACTIALSGCMTQQGGQQSEFGQAMMSGLAQGLLSGAGASLGHGIATGSKRHFAAAAAQAVVGTAATAAATSSRSKAPSPRAVSSFSGSHERHPNTPQCREFMRYAKKSSSAALMGAEGAYTRLVQMEHNCLASDPKHPLSKSRACGGGRYYHNFNDKLYCGWREAVAAYRHWAATNIRGMPADRYLQAYGLMSLFR